MVLWTGLPVWTADIPTDTFDLYSGIPYYKDKVCIYSSSRYLQLAELLPQGWTKVREVVLRTR
jgi:hypothetical protein